MLKYGELPDKGIDRDLFNDFVRHQVVKKAGVNFMEGMNMKKKVVISVIAMLILISLAAIFYFAPKTFGKNVNPSDVNRIEIFDGNTGVSFTIDNPEEIKYIVENIQSNQMKKDGISFGRMGYGLKITCVNDNDKVIISEIILNSDDTIRKDPFFYKCDGGLCFDYIKGIESRTKE